MATIGRLLLVLEDENGENTIHIINNILLKDLIKTEVISRIKCVVDSFIQL